MVTLMDQMGDLALWMNWDMYIFFRGGEEGEWVRAFEGFQFMVSRPSLSDIFPSTDKISTGGPAVLESSNRRRLVDPVLISRRRCRRRLLPCSPSLLTLPLVL